MLTIQPYQNFGTQKQVTNKQNVAFRAWERTLLEITPDAYAEKVADKVKAEIFAETGLNVVASTAKKQMVDGVRMKSRLFVLEGENALETLKNVVTKFKNFAKASVSTEEADREIPKFFIR